MLRTPVILTSVLLALCGAPPAVAQGDLSRQVTEILRVADGGSVQDAWGAGLRLADLDGPTDALARAIVSGAEGAGGKARLAAATALRDLADGEIFGKEILDLLTPVANGDDPEQQVAAVSVLADDSLFNRRVLPDVRDLLAKKVTNDLLDADVRIEAARGLWRIGSESEQLQSKRTLNEFLEARDPALSVRAALALAELNSDLSGKAGDVLRSVAGQPTLEGKLATSYIRREEERRLFQRRLRQIVLQQLDERGNGQDGTNDEFARLRELILSARTNHIRGGDFEEQELIEAAAKGLMESLDPHSAYFTSDEYQRFFFDLNREYGGIGAFVNFDRDNVFSIIRPIYSGPAYAAGLKSGDKILEVDGWETRGHTSEEIIERLKGEPGTAVVIKIMRPGLQEPQDVSIERAQIRVPSVNAELLPGGVGYVELVNFAQSTAMELRDALTQLKSDGMTSLVLDVRNNTGGYLLAARDVVELFVPANELVVYTQGRDPDERLDYRTRPGRAMFLDLPMAVLINEYTASASEITAGALQDLGRATIVGTRSFGKGSVQQLLPLRSDQGEEFDDKNDDGIRDEWETFTDSNQNEKFDAGPRMKLTVARYHLPSGRSIHKEVASDGKVLNPDWGVQPDIEIELREVSALDAWKNAEIFEIFQQGKFQDYVRAQLKANPQLVLELADGDLGRTDRYPGFDEFYESLDTHLSKDDVRRWVRYIARDEVADLRGKAYPGGRAFGDIQEDAQLQKAIENVLEKQGKEIAEIPAYRDVLKTDAAPTGDRTAKKEGDR